MSERYQSGSMMPPVTDEERWSEAERVIGEIFEGNALDSTREGSTVNVKSEVISGGVHNLQLWRRISKEAFIRGTRVIHISPTGDESVYDIYPSGYVIQDIRDDDAQIVRNKRKLALLLSHVTLVGLTSSDHEAFERIAQYNSQE